MDPRDGLDVRVPDDLDLSCLGERSTLYRLPPELAINLAEFAARKRVPLALLVETALAS
jgi:hypothetical protein